MVAVQALRDKVAASAERPREQAAAAAAAGDEGNTEQQHDAAEGEGATPDLTNQDLDAL